MNLIDKLRSKICSQSFLTIKAMNNWICLETILVVLIKVKSLNKLNKNWMKANRLTSEMRKIYSKESTNHSVLLKLILTNRHPLKVNHRLILLCQKKMIRRTQMQQLMKMILSIVSTTRKSKSIKMKSLYSWWNSPTLPTNLSKKNNSKKHMSYFRRQNLYSRS